MMNLGQVVAANRAGQQAGVYSICSAHAVVIEAGMRQGERDDTLVLIEATANQVNQYGGYTGMQPAHFRARVDEIARSAQIDGTRLLLGGDHLGPTLWTAEPAHSAMAKARQLVATYSAAGFGKIHLDTSMSCSDDPPRLTDETVAIRAAELCQAAEAAALQHHGTSELLYVIGTEVPPPGGAAEDTAAFRITEAASAKRAIETHESAFRDFGLHDAWERVIALVVQPGVEFDNRSVRDYEPCDAKPLSKLITEAPNLVFEAHSTDYQLPDAYAALIRDHFAILKVGPQLTYAVREALFALSHIEEELVPEADRANLRCVCEQAMLKEPAHWRRFCPDAGTMGLVARQFGYSDRIRYYWGNRDVASSVNRLLRNLSVGELPLPLLEQYMPLQYAAVRDGRLDRNPKDLVLHNVMRVTERYSRACQGDGRAPAR